MWKCKKCKEEVEEQYDVCWNCGSDRLGTIVLNKEDQETLKEVKTEIALEDSRTKYPALKAISGIYSISAWIVGIVTIILTLYFGIKGEAAFIIAIPIFVIGVLLTLGILAISEAIMVMIDIEYNTRQKGKSK